MKRGYMDLRTELLPREQLEARQKEFIQGFADADIDAAVVYADVASADELIFLTNLGPYWVNTAGIFFKDGRVFIVTGFSPRVNPWVAHITGMAPELIVAAGTKINAKVASILKEQIGGKGVIGITGGYFPQEMADAIHSAGFETAVYEKSPKGQLTKRDKAYLATIGQGIGLMGPAIEKVLKSPETGGMTRRQVAAEIEYACRTAGAMDFIILNGDENLIFDQPQDIAESEKPWTVYIQIQYLGEWLVRAFNMEEGYASNALASRDKFAEGLKPGRAGLSCSRDGYDFRVCTKITSDHLFAPERDTSALSDGQVVTLAVADRARGIYLENMYFVSERGGRLLF